MRCIWLAGQGLNLGLADAGAGAVECWSGGARAVAPARRRAPAAPLRPRAQRVPTLAMSRLTDGLLHPVRAARAAARELRNHGMTLVQQLGPLKRWLTARALDA